MSDNAPLVELLYPFLRHDVTCTVAVSAQPESNRCTCGLALAWALAGAPCAPSEETRDQTAGSAHTRTPEAATTPTCSDCGAPLVQNREWFVWQCPNGHPYQDEMARLRALLRDITVAANRMRDGWAEGDDAYKQQLWRALHEAADAASDEVYPL